MLWQRIQHDVIDTLQKENSRLKRENEDLNLQVNRQLEIIREKTILSADTERRIDELQKSFALFLMLYIDFFYLSIMELLLSQSGIK